ncbi:endonuclease MutS2 [Enterococcus sp. CWB-B31]|uniref:endonuclease MutS2 n=1 Tax=Enterococcus sp. CWB-B31 TaxID=2885159 RepID=UPI001E34B1FA|nr:endonuclease MutS2 [Enterococcus sp. CWB-B31]MCB5955619.1 endonuclease MutS2 [Enterococcus sp. CWB-B31]
MNKNIYNAIQFNIIKDELKKYAFSQFAKNTIDKREPSTSEAAVQRWLDETEEAVTILSSGQHVPFMGLSRIEQLTNQINKGMVLEAGELVEYADFLRSFRLIAKLFEKNQYQTPILYSYTNDLTDFSDIASVIYEFIQGNRVNSESSKELKRIRSQIAKLEKEIDQRLRKFMANGQNQKKLQDRLILMKDERYTVPVKIEFKQQVSGTIIDQSSKGTTVFIEPDTVRKYNDLLIMERAAEVGEVYQLLAYLTGLIGEQMETISYCMDVVTELEIIFSRGKYSRSINGKKPLINKEERIILKNVTHPLLTDPIPLTLDLGVDNRALIITGANAGGKTIVLKTVALVSLMTMFGILIANEEGTDIAVFDNIFIDIGDQQSLENSLSTFSGHMQNLSDVLKQVNRHTLVLLDEIGSGTDPNEGAALGIALMEEMYRKGSLVIATTHFGEIKEFALQHEDFTTAGMAFETDTLTPKYRLLLGETGESHAFWIAEKMKINARVLTQAAEYLKNRSYNRSKQAFHSVTKAKPESVTQAANYEFSKGDRVCLNDSQKIGLYFETENEYNGLVYVDKEMIEVPLRRLTLLRTADELYPSGYDLDSLFESFAARKLRKDLDRGAKKAQKKLDKEMKQRRDDRF